MAESHWLIALTGPPALEETIVDWLLNLEVSGGFTSFPVSGHSSHTRGLTLAEQVSGRKRQVRFELHVAESAVQAIVDRLHHDFHGTGLHYWTFPLGHHGKI